MVRILNGSQKTFSISESFNAVVFDKKINVIRFDG